MLLEDACPRVQALQLSIEFNTAFCYEQSAANAKARVIYESIIAREPTYVDAYLRLAYLERDAGDLKKAITLVDLAKQHHIKRPGYHLPTNLYCFKAMLLQ